MNEKADHYYSKKPRSTVRLRAGMMMVRGRAFRFITSSGVFSPKAIDRGTLLLVENMRLHGGKILDMGAGYGVIGIVAAAICPEADVTMVEINERALELAKKNARLNGVSVRILQGDFFEPIKHEKFDCIVMNPPIALGMSKLGAFIADSRRRLNSGGTLQLVARHNKGGRMLEESMFKNFENVEQIAKGGGFRIYVSKLL